MQDIELTDIQTQVRQAVAELPKREKSVISLYYFDSQNLAQIAEILSVSPQMVRSIKNKGLRILRQNKAIRSIYGEFERHYTHREYVYQQCAEDWELSRERREVKQAIEQRRLDGEYISYGEEQCILYREEQKYIREHAGSMSIFYRCR